MIFNELTSDYTHMVSRDSRRNSRADGRELAGVKEVIQDIVGTLDKVV